MTADIPFILDALRESSTVEIEVCLSLKSYSFFVKVTFIVFWFHNIPKKQKERKGLIAHVLYGVWYLKN